MEKYGSFFFLSLSFSPFETFELISFYWIAATTTAVLKFGVEKRDKKIVCFWRAECVLRQSVLFVPIHQNIFKLHHHSWL